MNNHKMRLVSSGIISSVGGDSRATAAAVNAGINACNQTIHINKNLDAIKAAWVPEGALPPLNDKVAAVPRLSSSYKRMIQLLHPPLLECMQSYMSEEPLPLFLACPEAHPSVAPENYQSIIHHIKAQTGLPLDVSSSRIFATGRAGGVHALDLACRYFAATHRPFALVAGVETSKFALQQIGALDRDNRLSANNIADGFALGEGAAAVLLINANLEADYGITQGLTIFDPGFGEEAGHFYSKEVYRGEGLAAAFARAIQQGPGLPINAIYSSMNGESYWGKEFGVACIRNKDALVEDIAHEHPADCMGDVGAAYGPMALALIAQQKFARTLLYCSSDSQYRAAVYLVNDGVHPK